MRKIVSPLDGFGSPFNALSSFSPALLFRQGEVGVWYDPSDFTTMFQDSAGTTPVTAVEQPVGLILDKSKGLAVGSELVTNGTFATDLNGWTVGTDPSNVTAVWSSGAAVLTRGTGTINGFSQTFTVPISGTYIIKFTVVSGTAAANNGFGGGLTGARTRYVGLNAGANTIQFWPNDLSSSCTIDNVSVKLIAGNHASQSTAASRPVLKIDGNGKYYLLFDGVDDSLATGTISPGSVDKVSLFTGLRKNSDAAQALVTGLGNITQSGALELFAPISAGANITFAVNGSTTFVQAAYTNASIAAPYTAVLTGIGDLSLASGDAVLRINGSLIATSTSDAGNTSFRSDVLQIGRRGGSTLPFNGQLYSMILRFSGTNLDATTISKMETWVNSKTGAY